MKFKSLVSYRQNCVQYQTMNKLQEKEELQTKICSLMSEKEKFLLRFCGEGIPKTVPSIQGKKTEVENELKLARAKLESARNSHRLLGELYSSGSNEKNKSVFNPEEFQRLKQEYVKKISAGAALQERLRAKRTELFNLRDGISSLELELERVRGKKEAPQNPWKIGVPYGYGVKRDKFSDRNKKF